MNARVVRLGWMAGVLLMLVVPRGATVLAEETAAAVEAETRSWSVPLTLGIFGSENEVFAQADLLVPLFPYDRGLFFINPRGTISDDNEEEVNIGLGWRHLIECRIPFVLGANVFYDSRWTRHNHRFDQVGVGVEFLSDWVDARANYYWPDDDTHVIETGQTETVTVAQKTRQRREVLGWGDPYGRIHQVVQDHTTRTTTSRIRTRHTLRQYYERFEGAMEGWDAELGLRLPNPTDHFDMRVFAGYQRFENPFEADDLKGWKARVEVRTMDGRLTFDGEWFENEDLNRTDYLVGARVRLPFDIAAISQKRNPFAGAPRGEPRDLRGRLDEMVMRDPNIRVTESDFMENLDLREETTERKVRTRTSDETQRIVLLDDVRFVDGNAPVSGDGTAERPYRSIQEGADTVFGQRNVYVHNASRPYNENVSLQPGTTLWGSGVQIIGMENRAFGSGVMPIVDGLSRGPAVSLSDGNTVQGLHIRNTDLGGPALLAQVDGLPAVDISRVGLFGDNATDLRITRNLIAGAAGDGALFLRRGDFNLDFTHNTVQDNAGDGLRIEAAGTSGSFGVRIQDSPFLDQGGAGLNLNASRYDVASVGIFNSLFAGNASHGAALTFDTVQMVNAVVQGSGFTDNQENGLSLLAFEGGRLDAAIENSRFTGNTLAGAELIAHDYEFALSRIRDSLLSGNRAAGLSIENFNTMLSMALVSGVNASQNEGDGIMIRQYDNLLSMANVSGTEAHGNRQSGVHLDQNGLVSIGVLGMPEGFGDMVNGILNLVGVALPGELQEFFEPTGPVETLRNQWDGVSGRVEGNMLALGVFSDIHTSFNQGWGLRAEVLSPLIALGLAGSSQNLSEILQLGSDVAGFFGLDLPLTIPGGGRMNASHNDGGVMLNVHGGLGAVANLLGADISGNRGLGALVTSEAGFLALSAAARIHATDNVHGNLSLDARAGGVALGLLADINASDSANGFGIDANVESGGVAALLTLSTDALRPLAGLLGEAFLGEPYDLPGDPWGAVTANHNFGPGIAANVVGDNFALAAFLDTQANNNETGFDVNVLSSSGTALAAFLSTDLIYDFVSDQLGGDPIPNAGLGGIQANGNHTGSGINLLVDGNAMAVALLAGVEANQNLDGGIQASIRSENGGAEAYVIAVDANDNQAGDGLSLDVHTSFGNAMAGLAYVNANDNAGSGIRLNAVSDNASTFALLADVDAYRNGQTGIELSLTAAGDAAAGITYTYAHDNRGRGLNAVIQADGDISVFAGATAADDLDTAYGVGSGLAGLFYGFLPQGDNRFSDNDTAGLRVNAVSTGGDVRMFISDTIANRNGTRGVNLLLDARDGDITTVVQNVSATGNEQQGIRVVLDGANGTASAWFADNVAHDNEGSGILVLGTYDGVQLRIGGERNVMVDNGGNGIRLNMNNIATADIQVDFGGGALGSLGLNSFFGNDNRDFFYNGLPMADAQFNWWGVAPPAGSQYSAGVNVNNWLLADPNP